MLRHPARFSERYPAHGFFQSGCRSLAVVTLLATLILLSGCGVTPAPAAPSNAAPGDAAIVFSDISATMAPGDTATIQVQVAGDGTKAAPTGVLQYTVAGPNQDGPLTGSMQLPQTALTIPKVSAGTYSIQVSYAGDANYASSQATRSFTVAKLTPAVAVSAAASMQAFAKNSVNASVGAGRDAAPPATGSLTYSVPGLATVQGSCSLDAASHCGQMLALPAGSWHVLWSYSGDANYNAATADMSVDVAKLTPALVLSAAQSSTSATASDVITAALTGDAAAVPTGTVRWSSSATCTDGTVTGSLTLPASTFTLSQMCGGTYTVAGTYSGDANYVGATASVTIAVAKLTPRLTLSAAQSTLTATQDDVITATLTGVPAGAPTGTIQWFSVSTCAEGNASGSIRLPANSFTLANLCGGNYSVTATYSGDANYLAQTGSTALQVSKVMPSFAITAPTKAVSSEDTVPVQLSWTGTAAKQAPGGTVTVACGTTGVCDASSAAASASSALVGPFSSVGVIPLVAHYAGDDFYAAADATASLTTAQPFRVTVNQDTVIYPGSTALWTVSVAAGASTSGTVTVTAAALPSWCRRTRCRLQSAVREQ